MVTSCTEGDEVFPMCTHILHPRIPLLTLTSTTEEELNFKCFTINIGDLNSLTFSPDQLFP